MRKVHVSSSVNVRVDDNVCYRFVVCALACVADNIPVFFKHIHCLRKVGGVLKQCASAQLVQVVLSDIRDMLGAYLVYHTFCLDSAEVNVTETVSIYRLLSEILTDLDSVTERIKRDTVLRWLNTIQSTLDTMNDTAQAEQFAVILTAPVLAECHIRDEVRLNVVIVVVNELPVRLFIEVEIQLFFVVISKLLTEEFVYQLLVILCNSFGNSLCIVLTMTDIAYGETIQKTCYQSAATEHRIVYHAIKHIWLTRKADAHVWLFKHYARPGRSVADIRFTIPRFQQEVKVRYIVAVTSAEITEHSGFIGYHKECAVFFKQIHKRFGCNIVNSYPAEVARRHIAKVCLQLGNLLGGNVFFLFKCFELALKQLSFCLRRVDVLLVVIFQS